MNTYAVDFETSYTKDRDIKSLGVVGYLRHPETDAYLVSVYGDGVSYYGPPESAPWDSIVGAHWASHNMSFDRAVYDELRRRYPGKYPTPPDEWDCTADMVAGLQCKRSLADAMKVLEGVKVDKTVRDDMRGVAWTDLDDAGKAAVGEYALKDSMFCHLLWTKYSAQWPEFERQLSRHTARMCHKGIAVDAPRVATGIEVLTQRLFEVERDIPWVGELDEKGKEIPVTSSKAIIRQCSKLGIPAPSSTDVKSPLWEKWESEFAETAPFVASIQKWRKVNRVLNVLRSIRNRTLDGICYYELKMCGAPHTRRWSGGYESSANVTTSSALNIQNLPKEAVEGIDVRRCFIPRPGNKFVISDLAQIEARALLWIAGDEAMLTRLRRGEDLYQAHAEVTMGYRDSVRAYAY
jgi:hypothetical protein